MSISEIRAKAHNDVLDARKFQRLVLSDQFERAYKLATSKQLTHLSIILMSSNSSNLKAWIKAVLCNDLNVVTWATLREIASAAQIPYYSRLPRRKLIVELQERGYGKPVESHNRNT